MFGNNGHFKLERHSECTCNMRKTGCLWIWNEAYQVPYSFRFKWTLFPSENTLQNKNWKLLVVLHFDCQAIAPENLPAATRTTEHHPEYSLVPHQVMAMVAQIENTAAASAKKFSAASPANNSSSTSGNCIPTIDLNVVWGNGRNPY